MSGFVLDASVAAKWILPESGEPYADRADSVLRSFTQETVNLIVPDLFWPEIGSVLWKACRQGRISPETADRAVAELNDLSIPTYATRELIKDAFRIALRYSCTVYDCIYVALAIVSNRTFLTADERLAKGLAAYFPVRWLGAV